MHLPSPPDNQEKYAYLDQKKSVLLTFSALSSVVVVASQFLFASMHVYLFPFYVIGLFFATYLGLSAFIITRRSFYEKLTYQTLRFAYHEEFATVDVFLPSCGEPLELLENTYKHVAKLSYPRVKVFVLDDSGRKEVEALAGKYKFEYLCREDRGVMKKAGNLRFGFKQTNGEFILILDADFVPRSDMLQEMLPWMVYDEKIAIIQSPQYFDVIPKKMGWVEAGGGYIQEFFYRIVQQSRDALGGAICVGTCALYRRDSLVPFGGTALIGYSEDVHTGVAVQQNGWKVRYLPLNLSKGVCPEKVSDFFNQQYRWCMGSLTLMTNPSFWSGNMTKMSKLCYLSGFFYYLATAFGAVLAPLPSVILAVWFPDKIHWYSALFCVPSITFSMIVTAGWSRHPWGVYAVRARQAQSWAHLFAVIDKCRGNLLQWVPTGGQAKPSSRFVTYQRVSSLSNGIVFLSLSAGLFQAGCELEAVPTFLLAISRFVLAMSAIR